jgi:hypothetical protein
MGALQALGAPRDADFYLCGPPGFMSDLTVDLAAWGVDANRVHTEIFGSSPSMMPGVAAGPRRPPHLPEGPDGVGPLRSNLSVRWGSAFGSLLELAEACDVPVRWSCRTRVKSELGEAKQQLRQSRDEAQRAQQEVREAREAAERARQDALKIATVESQTTQTAPQAQAVAAAPPAAAAASEAVGPKGARPSPPLMAGCLSPSAD